MMPDVEIRLSEDLLDYVVEAGADGKRVIHSVDGQGKVLWDGIEVALDDSALKRFVQVTLKFQLRGRTVVTCKWAAAPHDTLQLSGFAGEVDFNMEAETTPF
jgi:hypothetical protein